MDSRTLCTDRCADDDVIGIRNRMIAMYAVVKTGGKQYRVSKDDTILVEKLDIDEGQTVTFS